MQRVVIDISAGSFTIRNGAGDRLALSGIASRDYDGSKEAIWAQKVVDDTSVEIVVNGAEAIVRRKFGKNAQSFRAQKFTGIDLRLDLPTGMDVDFDTSAGEIDMDGDFGDIDIDLRAGEVDVASAAQARARAQRLLPRRRSPHAPRHRDRHARRPLPRQDPLLQRRRHRARERARHGGGSGRDVDAVT